MFWRDNFFYVEGPANFPYVSGPFFLYKSLHSYTIESTLAAPGLH